MHTATPKAGRRIGRCPRALVGGLGVAVLLLATACGNDGSSSGGSSGSSEEEVAVSLITKDSVNSFFVAMQEGAKEAAKEQNVKLT